MKDIRLPLAEFWLATTLSYHSRGVSSSAYSNTDLAATRQLLTNLINSSSSALSYAALASRSSARACRSFPVYFIVFLGAYHYRAIPKPDRLHAVDADGRRRRSPGPYLGHGPAAPNAFGTKPRKAAHRVSASASCLGHDLGIYPLTMSRRSIIKKVLTRRRPSFGGSTCGK